MMLLNCGVGEYLIVLWIARRSNQSIPKEITEDEKTRLGFKEKLPGEAGDLVAGLDDSHQFGSSLKVLGEE